MPLHDTGEPGITCEEWAGRVVDNAMSRVYTGRHFKQSEAIGFGEMTPERREKLREAAEETRRRKLERQKAVGNGVAIIVR
jgi:hypothetical protein